MINAQPFQVGEIIIGEYQVLDVFGGEGKSGMGIVYLVEQKDYPFPIILKTIQKDDSLLTQRFLAEAESWVSIGIHPNIVQAHFVKSINEQIFIGAEYIAPDALQRNTVTDYIEQGGVSNQYLLRWAAQFCYGMEHAEKKGLKAHRDIKPDNLMIDQSGNLKITDFGLAKAFVNFKNRPRKPAESLHTNVTSQGSFLGTLLYSAPEQIDDSSSVDIRADIYSFGIVLYQLFSKGGFPYAIEGRTSTEEIAIMHLIEPIIKVDHSLFPIAEKCLAKLPANRFQTFDELLTALSRIAEDLEIKLPINRSEPNDQIWELYIQSLSFLELGDKKRALDLINQYLEVDQMDSSSWQLKGRILFEMDHVREGIAATQRSYELDPYNPRTINNLGAYYGELGEQDKAISFLMEAIKIDGYNSGAVMNLAIALNKRGAYLGASEMILKALEQAPDKETIHFNAFNIASSAMKNGQSDKAIEILEILKQLKPDKPDIWFNLGLCHESKGRKELAIECLEEVLNINPEDEQALSFLARWSAEMGRFEEALAYCEEMLEKEISLMQAIAIKAQVLQALGNSGEALQFLKTVIKSGHEENDTLWVLLGELFEKQKRYDEAMKCFTKARTLLLVGNNTNEENVNFLDHKLSRLEFLSNHSPSKIVDMIKTGEDSNQ